MISAIAAPLPHTKIQETATRHAWKFGCANCCESSRTARQVRPKWICGASLFLDGRWRIVHKIVVPCGASTSDMYIMLGAPACYSSANSKAQHPEIVKPIIGLSKAAGHSNTILAVERYNVSVKPSTSIGKSFVPSQYGRPDSTFDGVCPDV